MIGPLSLVYGRRYKNKRPILYIKRIEVWLHRGAKLGWQSIREDCVPRAKKRAYQRRKKQRKIWPWPNAVEEEKLQLILRAGFRKDHHWDGWFLNKEPEITTTNSNGDETTDDESDCNEDDEV